MRKENRRLKHPLKTFTGKEKKRLITREFWKACCILVLFFTSLQAQTTSLPLSHRAYQTLDRWETRGIISNVFNSTRPYTREEAAEYLIKAWNSFQENEEAFSKTDRQELYYLSLELQEELTRAGYRIPGNNRQPRMQRLFRHAPFSWLSPYIYRNSRNMVSL
ncbi:MAG: hypothetical protein WAN36_12900, partial [Calditrichia bacterium]